MKEGDYRPQPKQPEHTQPLQGRAQGKQSLQGPTTVDGSEQLQPSREREQSSRDNLDRQPEQSLQDGSSKSPEHKPRTRIVYNPRKETREEYKKRYHEAHAQRDAEEKEKLRKYNRKYKRRWRKARKEQRAAALTQREPEQPKATQIFPSLSHPTLTPARYIKGRTVDKIMACGILAERACM